MIPLVIIRPEPGAGRSRRAAAALGLDAHAFPLFAVRPVDWQPPPRDEVDALLLGSANVLRHGGPALASLAGLPVHAVGAATARAARRAGFPVATVGEGTLQAVLDAAPASHRRLLRPCGRDRVPLTVPDGRSLIERVCYASEPLPMPAALAERLRQPAVVALHSPQAARHFAAECDRLGIPRDRVAVCCLSQRIAGAAGPGWRGVGVAAQTTEAALLALAVRMCQNAHRPTTEAD